MVLPTVPTKGSHRQSCFILHDPEFPCMTVGNYRTGRSKVIKKQSILWLASRLRGGQHEKINIRNRLIRFPPMNLN